MEILEAKQQVKLMQWSEMIHARMASGKTVKTWCKENGLNIKTYYYWLRKVRHAALQEPAQEGVSFSIAEAARPVFAELPIRAASKNTDRQDSTAIGACALTVRMGLVSIEINNGADPDVIAQTLHIVREIC